MSNKSNPWSGIRTTVGLVVLMVSAIYPVAEAQDGVVIFNNPIRYSSLTELLVELADGVTLILMPFIVLGIVYVGFRMVMAGRDKTSEYTKLKKQFGYALLGLFLVLGARGILAIIQNTVKDVLGPEYTSSLDEQVKLTTQTTVSPETALSNVRKEQAT